MKGQYPELKYMHASLNGVQLPKKYAITIKRQGMKAGVCDLFLPVGRGGFSGLYIEMKRQKPEKSEISEAQQDYIDFVTRQHYKAIVCYGADEAQAETIRYLKQPPTVYGV